MKNPQITQLVEDQYDQVLTRTYVNGDGYRIMLSLACSKDQRGAGQAHRPEVCYPGQGFEIAKVEHGALQTTFGNVPVRRLETSLGSRREPVTYWLTVRDRVVNDQFARRIAEIETVLEGRLPDGMLFRISSIDGEPTRAFNMHQKFAADLMGSVPPRIRQKLSGLAPTAAS